MKFTKKKKTLCINRFSQQCYVIMSLVPGDRASRVGDCYKSHLQLTGRLNHHAPLRLLRQNLPWIRPCLSTLRSNYCASLTIHIYIQSLSLWMSERQVYKLKRVNLRYIYRYSFINHLKRSSRTRIGAHFMVPGYRHFILPR